MTKKSKLLLLIAVSIHLSATVTLARQLLTPINYYQLVSLIERTAPNSNGESCGLALNENKKFKMEIAKSIDSYGLSVGNSPEINRNYNLPAGADSVLSIQIFLSKLNPGDKTDQYNFDCKSFELTPSIIK